jgi:hypothetical protein
MKLPVDTSAIAFLCAVEAEPVIDFETKRPRADENGEPLRHTAVALWIAAGAGPKEVAARAGHTSVSFTLDRYGHLYPEADTALRDRLDALYVAGGQAGPGMVIELPRDRSRPQRGPQQDERRQ